MNQPFKPTPEQERAAAAEAARQTRAHLLKYADTMTPEERVKHADRVVELERRAGIGGSP